MYILYIYITLFILHIPLLTTTSLCAVHSQVDRRVASPQMRATKKPHKSRADSKLAASETQTSSRHLKGTSVQVDNDLA